jgi:alpha-glucosidase
MLINILFYLN